METCRICQQECSEDQLFCSNCGYPLNTFPPILGEIPPSYQDILSQRERWEKDIWQKYQQLQQQHTELSRDYQQLQQQFDKQQQEANNNTQLQQQIAQLKQENATLQERLESYNQFQQSQQQLIEQLREVLQESQRRQSQENSQSYKQLQQQIGQLQQEIANLQQEVTRLTPKSESPNQFQQQILETPLESSIGCDYTKLRELLAAGKWIEADEETAKVMLKVVGKEQLGKLSKKDIDNFPCKDLQTIDRLWVKSSNGKFGLSVQKRIYQNLGGTKRLDPEIWEKFGDIVGWRTKEGYWKDYSQVIKKVAGYLPEGIPGYVPDNVPEGCFPWLGWVHRGYRKGMGLGIYGAWWFCQRTLKLLCILSREDL
ncbi:GUN4 domain-containing protein [Geitlerinema sp. PCC 9228]|uniref:GUN4 domain-containing protein n=1 Tax=Geitlerinema sp. PCC 9228 TaxID=111611 RepID=UPI0008F99425|nr:GUN4 domain-containing protein [Geitlerinema sp. PCC 9228]